MSLAPPRELDHPDLQATEARQARPGVPVLWVLAVSTIVALVAVIVIWAAYSHRLGAAAPPQVTNPAQAARFSAQSPSPPPAKTP